MLIFEVAALSNRLAGESGRLDKIRLLADLLQRLDPDEIPVVTAWLSGRLRQGRIGVGWSTLRGAANSGSASRAIAPELFPVAPVSPAPLTVLEVDRTFDRLASVSGRGAAAERERALAVLWSRAGREEREFLERLLMGELRQGALGGVMEEAVARASGLPISELRRAAMLAGDLTPVAAAALVEGAAGLARFRLVLFQPVAPMLAQPALDLDDALARLAEPAFEHKLDGARIQVHRAGDEIRVYTRQLNEVTAAVPEVVAAIRALPVRQAILDGEALALRPDGRPQPFQITMRRFGSRLAVARLEQELPLAAWYFDVLHLDGADTIDRPARERFALLRERAAALAVPQLVTSDPARAAAFFDEALARGHEGLMAKALDSRYEAGARGSAWLKVKTAHTLDLVVLAAEWGSGRRRGWLSNIHLGARDPARNPTTGGFAMLGKTFKGMTDEMLEWQTHAFEALATRREGHVVHLRPELVVEVSFDDVQESPRYDSGMALRLARVKRYRPDKSPAKADTVETVRAILEGRVAKRRRG